MGDKPSLEAQCVRDLLKRKRDLERSFDRLRRKGGSRVYTHVYYAYTNVIRALVDIARAAPPERKDPEEMQRLAREILRTEYGITRGGYNE